MKEQRPRVGLPCGGWCSHFSGEVRLINLTRIMSPVTEVLFGGTKIPSRTGFRNGSFGSLAPVVGNPRCRTNVLVEFLVPLLGRPVSDQGIKGIRVTRKRDHAGVRGPRRRLPPALRHRWDAVGLEQRTPLVRPVSHLGNRLRDVDLLVVELGEDGLEFRNKAIVDVGVGADPEAEHRGVANALAGLRPVLHHDEGFLGREIEEVVQAPRHDHIKVQEQPVPLHARKLAGSQRDLAPAGVVVWGSKGHGRAGNALDLAAESARIVRHADKSNRSRGIPADHRIQLVRILGRVQGAPFHADNLFHR